MTWWQENLSWFGGCFNSFFSTEFYWMCFNGSNEPLSFQWSLSTVSPWQRMEKSFTSQFFSNSSKDQICWAYMSTIVGEFQIPFLRPWRALREGKPFVGAFQTKLTTDSLLKGPFKSVSEGYMPWSLQGTYFIVYVIRYVKETTCEGWPH